jgi:hypothetical protein
MSLKTILTLIELLEKEGISYCHWKSNANLESALCGKDDLDILVADDNKEKFLWILSKLGFFKTLAPQDKWFPDISHYVTYDAESDKIVHIHLHDKLVLGHDLIKNYHLPVEKAFLRSAADSSGLKIPCYELEFIVFVIRMVLKRRGVSWAINQPKCWLKGCSGFGAGSLAKMARDELKFLQGQVNQDALNRCLHEHFPEISAELFKYCVDSISVKTKPFCWLFARRKLERVLKNFRMYSAFPAFFVVGFRMILSKTKSVLHRFGCSVFYRMRLPRGGFMVALTGGDGAGKTTNIEEINKWFGRYFDIYTIHIGKPTKRLWQHVAIFVLRVFRVVTRNYNFYYGFLFLLLAQRRYRAFCRARELRSKGAVVCLDRMPLPQLTAMDAPEIRKRTGGKGMYGRLAKMEEDYHRRIKGVDELIILRLEPALGAQRRPEHSGDDLRRRLDEVWNAEWPSGYGHVLDAGRPLDEVKQEIRRIVWQGIEKKQAAKDIY